jgi:hypothetical protein
MSKEAEITAVNETPPPAEGIRRGRIGLNVGIQIVLGVAIFVMVNILGHRRFKQWDYTYSRNFSLAANTQKFLKEVKEPLRISVLAARDEMMEKDIGPLLDQYKLALGGRLDVEFIDIRRDVTAWENFKIRLYKMGAAFKPDEGILVQADRPHIGESGGEKYYYKWIPGDSLYVMETDKHVPIAFRGESLLNTAIAGVTNPDRPRIGILAGMGFVQKVPNPEGGPELFSYAHVLADICSAQNIEVEPWYMMQDPDNALHYKSLIIVANTLFGPQQEEDLTRFFETPGNSVVVLLDPEHGNPGIDKWLSKYGIQPQEDRVLWAKSNAGGVYTQFAVNARFLDNSPVTRGMENHATLLPGRTRSLKLLNDLEKVKSENIQLIPLLTPTDEFWGDKNYKEKFPAFEAGVDNGKPLYVAASAERGAASDPRVQMQSSRLVAMGNADLANPPPEAPNYEFMTRMLNWCLHRDETAANDSSTDKSKHKFAISIKPEQWQRILIITTVVMPLAALMAGLLIWSTRRN